MKKFLSHKTLYIVKECYSYQKQFLQTVKCSLEIVEKCLIIITKIALNILDCCSISFMKMRNFEMISDDLSHLDLLKKQRLIGINIFPT